MTLRALIALCFFACFEANASSPLEASLRELSCGADHVLVGRVVGVDMIDAKRRPIHDDAAGTGPGSKNTIRLEVEVLEVIETTEADFPPTLKIPLDPVMHYSLGQIRAAHAEPSEPRLVFLSGAKHEPIIAGRFFWGLDAREEALVLRRECKP